MEPQERYLSKTEVAHWFGVSKRTIDIWTRHRNFPQPCRQPGGRPRWPASALENVMQRKDAS